jgi:hypothetical protein
LALTVTGVGGVELNPPPGMVLQFELVVSTVQA